MALTSSRRSELRAQAHSLDPVVIIGDKGLTDAVVAEIDRALDAHELIKVRAASADRDTREAWLGAICERLVAQPVQRIGKVLVIYREKAEERLGPGPSPRRGAQGDEPRHGGRDDKTKRAGRDDAKRTERRRSRTASRPPESAPRRRRPRSSR